MGVAPLLFGHSDTGYRNCHIIKSKRADNAAGLVNRGSLKKKKNAVALKKCTFLEDDQHTSEHLLQVHF